MGTSTEAGSRPGDTAPPAFVVRPAGPKDAASFLEMWRAVIAERKHVRTERASESARFYRRRYFRRSWSDDQASIVAVHGDRVIGHLNVSREDSPVTRHVASIGMAVASDWRGKGVGSALMSEAIRWGHRFGVEKLALSVYPDNEPALALYRKFGFQEEGRLTGHSKKSIGYRDEIVMGLWLIQRPHP
ncbi:MAG TPA: GNAT family N-acetyltransferase [Actinomycetota bacterium]